MEKERFLDIKSKFMCHLLDDIQLDCRSIGLVIDYQQSNTTFVFSNDGICCYDTCATRLASSLRGNSHTNLSDTRTKCSALVWVVFKAFQKYSIIIRYAAIKIGQSLDGYVKILMSIYFVTHPSTLRQKENLYRETNKTNE